LVGVTRVAGGDACNCKRKAKRHMRGIAICAESDFPTGETLEGTERRVVSCFPRIPNLQRGLSFVDVACPFNAEAPVNLVATMSAVAAD
jgi:hypothetical protein